MTPPTWTRSDDADFGLGRALVAVRDAHHACLGCFGALYILSDHRQLGRTVRPVGLDKALREGGWSTPDTAELAWLRGEGAS